jgi:UDP-N-acetylmuramate--alanine ligase
VADIYPAGEEPLPGVNSENLVGAIRQAGHPNVRYIGSLEGICSAAEKELLAGDLLITMGAGNIWKVGEELFRRLQ